MPKPKKERTPVPFPHWLIEAMACPACGAPCWYVESGGMTCRKVPAHTGQITKRDIEIKLFEAHALAKARGVTTWNLDQAKMWCYRYLKAVCRTPRLTDEVMW